MFKPIHTLQDIQGEKELKRYQMRWGTLQGRRDKKLILELINKGAGEDFLQGYFQAGKILTIENEWDLKGIDIWSINVDFPKDDNFEAIDFSYSRLWHSNFKKAAFVSGTGGSFARIYNCKFQDCLFYMSGWKGCTFEKVKFERCDFMEHTYFINCEFRDCKLKGNFLQKNIFYDCLFDSNTELITIEEKTNNFGKHNLDKRDVPEIYKGIKNSYLAGEVYDKYRDYFFLQKSSETRHVRSGIKKLCSIFFQEYIVGYGVRPLNTILASVFVILLFALFYSFCTISFEKSILMSLSAFATMGDIPQFSPFSFLYALESFLGIGLFALFITVLANVWFTEK